MKNKSLVSNTIYNFIYQGLNILFPLLISPYTARVLGANNLGLVNLSNNIVTWFIVIGTFGTTSYGIKEIAKIRDNKEKLDKTFSEIFIINFLMTIFSILLLLIIFYFSPFVGINFALYCTMIIRIIFNIFNIDWFFQGIEEYRYITVRQFFVRLATAILVFTLVKTQDDYIIYALLLSISIGISGFLNYIYSKNFSKLVFSNLNIYKHLKSLLSLFLTQITVNIYLNLDISLLGLLSTPTNISFLAQSKMVVGGANAVTNAITDSTTSRVSYYSVNDKKKFDELNEIIPNVVQMIAIPMVIGIFALSDQLMLIIGGEEFIPAGIVLKLISISILFSSLSGYLQKQYILVYNLEKIGLLTSIITSITSLILNITLIKLLGVIGTAITASLSEIVAFYSRYYFIKYKNRISIRIFNTNTLKYIFSGTIMYMVVFLICNSIKSLFISIILSIICGSCCYFIILFLMRERLIINLFYTIKNKRELN
ncbi:oligosaccharide flippase family protein [Globicatella sanguinis]